MRGEKGAGPRFVPLANKNQSKDKDLHGRHLLYTRFGLFGQFSKNRLKR